MIKIALRTLFFTISTLLLLTACGGGDKPKQGGQDTTAAVIDPAEGAEPEKSPAYCIWDNAALRAEPAKTGKYLSSLSVGEEVTYLEETKTDPNDAKREYIKVGLSDGSEGWVLANLFVIGGTRAVVDDNATIYKRPTC